MKRTALTLALIVSAYVAGTLAPHASAADVVGTVVSELRYIRLELHALTAAVERHK